MIIRSTRETKLRGSLATNSVFELMMARSSAQLHRRTRLSDDNAGSTGVPVGSDCGDIAVPLQVSFQDIMSTQSTWASKKTSTQSTSSPQDRHTATQICPISMRLQLDPARTRRRSRLDPTRLDRMISMARGLLKRSSCMKYSSREKARTDL
jgi:hypothetical protein